MKQEVPSDKWSMDRESDQERDIYGGGEDGRRGAVPVAYLLFLS